MKTLSEILNDSRFKLTIPEYKINECVQIQGEAAVMDIALSLKECEDIWQEWSDGMDAQWLSISNTEEIQQAIMSYIEKRTK